jgi:hypothetical protein
MSPLCIRALDGIIAKLLTHDCIIVMGSIGSRIGWQRSIGWRFGAPVCAPVHWLFKNRLAAHLPCDFAGAEACAAPATSILQNHIPPDQRPKAIFKHHLRAATFKGDSEESSEKNMSFRSLSVRYSPTTSSRTSVAYTTSTASDLTEKAPGRSDAASIRSIATTIQRQQHDKDLAIVVVVPRRSLGDAERRCRPSGLKFWKCKTACSPSHALVPS